MGKAKRKAERAAASVLGASAAAGVAKAAKKGARSDERGAPERADTHRHASASDVKPWRSREKPLVLCARGITYRYRHLMTDVMQLIPHHKTDSKLDTKHDWNAINEIVELKGATSVLFFEARKRSDLYLWLAKAPSGPSARFLCSNVHTMAELKLSGNHLKGSRPVLSFDAAFDEQPHLQVMKELLQQIFVTPKGHQKSKPFFDHVISFTYCDNRIWLRNYQVVVALDKKQVKQEGVTLIEVGPRVTMQPIKVFAGSFRGKVLFENPEYINPNAVRAYEKRKSMGAYGQKVHQTERRKAHVESNKIEESELADRKVFAAAASMHDSAEGGESDSDQEFVDALSVGEGDEDAMGSSGEDRGSMSSDE